MFVFSTLATYFKHIVILVLFVLFFAFNVIITLLQTQFVLIIFTELEIAEKIKLARSAIVVVPHCKRKKVVLVFNHYSCMTIIHMEIEGV